MTDHIESNAGAWVDFDRLARDLRDRRARQPGRSVLFPELGDARLRRQIVRWLAREYHETTPGILEMLRSALNDADWEVRASAIIVSARLRATPLRSAVRETPLPAAHQHGLSERDIRLLVVVRIIAAESLASAISDDTDPVQAIRRQLPDAPRDLVRSVLGLAVDQRDDAWLMLHALSTPSELADPLPEPPPRGLALHHRRAWLSGVVELCWVPPLMHFLGGEHMIRDQHGAPRGIREYTPSRGFFITRRPLSGADALQLGLSHVPARPHLDASVAARLADTPDAPLVMTYDDALALCEQISARSDAVVALPTADELECAARGTDGRRYPWGNGLERLRGADRSPHGIEQFSFPVAQWTSTLDVAGASMAMGGPTAPRCCQRNARLAASAVRIVVRQPRDEAGDRKPLLASRYVLRRPND
jgi:hypothetical protein